ncbi:MAG: hypothetical protein D8M53_12660 [Armatimonadetes bacterium]|nr:hypothetical protein [Armatimonadota bacterium]
MQANDARPSPLTRTKSMRERMSEIGCC